MPQRPIVSGPSWLWVLATTSDRARDLLLQRARAPSATSSWKTPIRSTETIATFCRPSLTATARAHRSSWTPVALRSWPKPARYTGFPPSSGVISALREAEAQPGRAAGGPGPGPGRGRAAEEQCHVTSAATIQPARPSRATASVPPPPSGPRRGPGGRATSPTRPAHPPRSRRPLPGARRASPGARGRSPGGAPGPSRGRRGGAARAARAPAGPGAPRAARARCGGGGCTPRRASLRRRRGGRSAGSSRRRRARRGRRARRRGRAP